MNKVLLKKISEKAKTLKISKTRFVEMAVEEFWKGFPDIHSRNWRASSTELQNRLRLPGASRLLLLRRLNLSAVSVDHERMPFRARARPEGECQTVRRRPFNLQAVQYVQNP